MAGLFPESSGECRLLDAGAGIGSLSSAFLERCSKGNMDFQSIRLKAYEIDGSFTKNFKTPFHSTTLYLTSLMK